MQVYNSPNEIVATDVQWWFLYNTITKVILTEPSLCSGTISSPLTLVIADTEEECNTYIASNDLYYLEN